MAGLPAQPLEFNDFSGGITENTLQGDPRRYARADNFLITPDKKLEERPGLIAQSVALYQLPSGQSRVNGSYFFINETQQIEQSGRNLYYIDSYTGVWKEIIGKGGNHAIQGGDAYSQNTFAEFQRQIFMTNDGSSSEFGIQPSKIYRNTSNVWEARTAGLPRAWVQGNYTDATLLSKCINLANSLRTSMIAHMSDASNPTYVPTIFDSNYSALHSNRDKYSLAYFVTQTFTPNVDPEIPNPVPTPAPNATDQASLFTLVTALNNAFTHHVPDSTLYSNANTLGPNYHFDINMYQLDVFTPTPKGPAVGLSNNATPTTLLQAASCLDDLLQKWNWHRKSVYTHSPDNNPAQFDRYAPTETKVGTVHEGNAAPTITGNYGDVYAYANNLRYMYNRHVTNGLNEPFLLFAGNHKMRDNFQHLLGLECRLPEAQSLDDLYLLIYWLRQLYFIHYLDANVAVATTFTGTTTAASPNWTSVVYAPSNLLVQGWFVESPNGFAARSSSGNYGGGFTTAQISSSGTGTGVMDRPSSLSGSTTAQTTISQYHGAYTSFSVFSSSTTARSTASDAMAIAPNAVGQDIPTWLSLANDMFFALANHAQNQTNHAQASKALFNALVSNVPYKPFFISSISTLAYAFFFTDDYTVEPNGLEYLVAGNPIFSDSLQLAKSYPVGYTVPDLNTAYYPNPTIVTNRTNVITNLPVLKNTASTNYAVDNVKLNIYRTTDGGNTYYLVDQVANGTTTYTDNDNDSVANPGEVALNLRQTIYTSGGVVGWDQPPQSKFIHILNGVTYYCGITDTGQQFPNRVRQSNQFQPDASPATFTDDLDDEITGISSTRTNLIAFCKSSIYRMSGGFNTQGQGALLHERISDTMGCVNAKSIIRTEIGVFFAGTDGFYYTDGYQLIKLSLELNKTYAALITTDSQKRSIYGAYDKITRRIYWAMKKDQTGDDNSIVYVYYLDYGVKPSAVFTTMTNGLNFRPSSLAFQNGILYMGHNKGFILKTDPDTKDDATVDALLPVQNWATQYIPFDFLSMAVDLGTTFKRKWVTKMHLVGKNTGNMALQSYALRDLNQTQAGAILMAPVNYVNNLRWGMPICVWGDATQKWEYDGKMDLWRRFPAGTLRSDFMQVQFKASDAIAYASSVGFPLGATAIVDATAKTATIQTPSGYTDIVWPLDCVGYDIAFATDGYANRFPVISQEQSQTINFSAAPGAGSWFLYYNNVLVSGFAWTAVAADVQQSLRLVAGLSAVVVTGDYVSGFTCTFNGVTTTPYSLTVVSALTLAPTTKIVKVTFGGMVPDAGNWVLLYNGIGASNMSSTANAAAVQTDARLNGGFSQTIVTGSFVAGFTIQLVGTANAVVAPSLPDNTLTMGGTPVPISVATLTPYVPGAPITMSVVRNVLVPNQHKLRFDDPSNLAVNMPSGVEWQIMGKKKAQRVTITSFDLHFAYLGDKNQAYPGAASNAGPGNNGANP